MRYIPWLVTASSFVALLAIHVTLPQAKATVLLHANRSGTRRHAASPLPFCGLMTSKRATVADILYKGNVGVPGKYGCNMMLVDEEIAEFYDHLIEFVNGAGQDQRCVCWLKIGPDGKVNG